MALLRLLAGIFFVFAALALAADLTRASSGNGFTMTSLAAHWTAFAPQMLASAKAKVQTVHPMVWDVIWRLLLLPTSFLLVSLGAAFAILGRRQRRVNIFIN